MPALQLDSSEQNGSINLDNNQKEKDCFSQRRIEFHLARKPFSASPKSCDFKLVTLNPSASGSCISNVSVSTNLSNKPSQCQSDLVDFSLDAELSFRIPFQRIGAGLENLGNTCYLNSVLQCLTYTEPLVAYLQSGKHQYTCNIAGFCALCAIHKHVSRALQSAGRILAPKDLVSNLRCISRNFRIARQEDAHEYMIQLLESMHKCCLPSGVPSESPGAYDKSLVYKIFGGRLRSQVKCLQCSHCSDTFDPFLDLSLEIVKADSLYKALSHFTAAEQLDGGERQYRCERCKQKVKAFKQLTIYKPPYVLGIHLKRFRSHLAEKKIDRKVHFGSTLDLKPFVSGAYEGDMMYKLYGVLVHAGWSTRSGHYYCFVRTPSGSWYSLDDRRVAQVSERTVLEQKAYMLFYVRDRKNFTCKKAIDVVQKENFMRTMQNASNSCSIPGVKVFQNGLKKTVDVARQEKLMTTMQNASSSCSIPGVKAFQNNCVDKTSKMISSNFVVKDSESSKVTEVQAQQNLSNPSTQPNNDTETIVAAAKEEASKSTMDIRPILSKSKRKLPSVKGSIPMKSPQCASHRQLMKSIFKSGIVGMNLSTKILYGASLSLKKRVKCRRMKLRKKNALSELVLNKNLLSADHGASTSGRISDSIDNSMSSSMKRSRTCKKEEEKDAAKKCSMSYESNSIVNSARQLEDRITCSKTELVTGKMLSKSAACSLEANGLIPVDSSYLKQPNSQSQNGANIAGARVQEEIAVGHWEGMESHILESNGQNSINIGYVLDDWDEEYDRGKRKKLRMSRNSYDGPNPFQQIAAKKAKLKARTDASNQPFRI